MGRSIPHHAQREAHDIASLAAHILVSRIYVEDAEMRELKAENERLRDLALNTQMTRVDRIIIPAKDAAR